MHFKNYKANHSLAPNRGHRVSPLARAGKGWGKGLWLIALLAMTVIACKSKKDDGDIVVEKMVDKPQTGPTSMKNDDKSATVKWIGNNYKYTISRHAIDSVEVENYDKKYHDNSIDLKILRSDGTVFFEKSLTKSSFSGLLSNEMKHHGVLCSVAYDKCDSNNMYFVANIGSPDETNEDFVLIQYIVDRFGNTQVATYTPELQE